jgi:hypothetical protein
VDGREKPIRHFVKGVRVVRRGPVIKFYLSRRRNPIAIRAPLAAAPAIEKIVKDIPAVFAIRSKMSIAMTISTTQAPAIGFFFISLSLPN